MLPSSGESWEIIWTLTALQPKKRAGTSSYGAGQTRRRWEGHSGFILHLSPSLNPTIFLFSVCAVMSAIHLLWTGVARRFNGNRMNAE